MAIMTYIIAEAAIQHHGRPGVAKTIARKAKDCGADAVKFQMFFPGEELFCPLAGDHDRWGRWRQSFMSRDQWWGVKKHCDKIGIDFLASAFQESAVRFLAELQPRYYKVASRAAETYPYDLVPGPFLISLGMCEDPPFCAGQQHFMQCRSEYPHPPEKWRGGLEGFSDHSGTPWPAIHAIARGCQVIELHVLFFTQQNDPDKSSSLTRPQFRMVCDARDAFAALG